MIGGIRMINENKNIRNCVECGKLIYIGGIKEPLCQDCAMIADFATLVAEWRGDTE